MIRVAVVGYGYWGPNLVRNYQEAKGTELVSVCDLDPSQIKKVQIRYPSVKTTCDFHDILNDPLVDAISIATPVATHHSLAMKALAAGKHLLVEKPLAGRYQDAIEMLEEAERRKLVLMVDHTFPYTGAVRKIKELVDSDELGEIYYYYDSVRVNLGLFQRDVSVIWDLAVHDLSIIEYLFPQSPSAVSATGMAHFRDQPENVAYLTLFWERNFVAHVNVNWLAPVKIRQTLIGGGKKMVVYDDLEFTEKIKVYDKGISVTENEEEIYKRRIGYRIGDMWAPVLDRTEALARLVEHFAACVEGREQPITTGASGARIVRIMEAATESLTKRGQVIKL